MSMRKEIGLPAPVRVTLGSIEVMRVGAWGPGHLQSSAASPRRLGRAGLKYSYLDQEGMSGSPEGGLGSRSSNVPLCHSWHMELEEPQWPPLPHLKQGPSGFLSLLADGGLEPCRTVAKRWYLA